jgi:hypothetical protein
MEQDMRNRSDQSYNRHFVIFMK